MSDITVRRVKFDFPESLDDVLPGADLVSESYMVAFSFTMPSLEPYLIRTVRAVSPKVRDQGLAEDLRAFVGQEAQHFQNHRRANEMVLRQLSVAAAARIQTILDELEFDYQRFSKEKSDRFNLVYAEGFEAMTCAMAMTAFDEAAASRGMSSSFGPWQQLWAWHAAEEIEHRTVAFDAYEHLVGSHPHRVAGSLRAQLHFQRYIGRLQRVVLEDRGAPVKHHWPPLLRSKEGRRRYRRTFRRSYHPGDLEPNPMIEFILSAFGS